MPSKEHFEIPRQRQTRPKGLPWVILQEQPFHLFCRETVNIISINLSEVYHKCCILNGCTSHYLFCDIVSSLIVCSCKQNKTKAAAGEVCMRLKWNIYLNREKQLFTNGAAPEHSTRQPMPSPDVSFITRGKEIKNIN